MLRRLTGRAFHKVGAATLKDLSPNDFFIRAQQIARISLSMNEISDVARCHAIEGFESK